MNKSEHSDLTKEFFKEEMDKNLTLLPNNESEPLEFDETFSLASQERNLIKKSLKKHNGKRKLAAEELGISERTLYRKIKEFNL